MTALKPKGFLRKTMMIFFLMVSLVFGPAGLIPIRAEAQSSVSTIQSQTDNNGSNDPNAIYVNYIKCLKIMGGFPDGGFHANEGLTRAQAAVVMCKTAGLDPITLQNSGFKDVNKNHWAAGYITAAVKVGYLAGFPGGIFRPEQKLTRVQGISLIMRLSKQSDPGVKLPELTDMTSSHWAARSMAVALDAGMIRLTSPGTIQPDTPLSRGDLCRALALLLVDDPDLAGCKLYGTLNVNKGEVQVRSGGSQTDRTIIAITQVGSGDIIKTGNNGEAVINYPDGSRLLLKSNSTLVIKESQGRSYITKDGRCGAGVDDLKVELQAGKIFGGLSSLAFSTIEAAKTEGAVPWYRSACQKKAKIKVSMPWGMTAIKGSFWQSAVNSNGSGSTNLLEGSAQVIAGGQTVSLSPGEASGGSSAGGPPSVPAPMTAQQAAEWAQVSAWVAETAATMTNNQGAPPAGEAPDNIPDPISALTEALQQAMTQAQNTANSYNASNSGSGGGGGSSGSDGGSCTMSAVKSVYYLPNSYFGPTSTVLPGSLSFHFTVDPDTATVTCSESGDDVVDTSITPAGYTRVVSLICKEDSPGVFRSGKETLTITASAPGRSSEVKTVEIYALPPVEATPCYLSTPYTTPEGITVFAPSGSMWTYGNDFSLQFIQAETCDTAVDNSGNPVSTSNFNVYSTDFNYKLDSALPVGHYLYIISQNGSPIAVGRLNVIDTPPALTSLSVGPAEYVSQSRFSALDYAGADHFLYRYGKPWNLSPPTVNETLDLNQWALAEVGGSAFSPPQGYGVMAAALDASNKVLASSWTMVDPTMVGRVPSDMFETSPSFEPGIWVSSTRVTGIADSACSSFKWLSSSSSFSSVTPADSADSTSQVFSTYTPCTAGDSIAGMTGGTTHIGIMGIDNGDKVIRFIDHTVATGEISSTEKAPDLTVAFDKGDTVGTTKITNVSAGTKLRIIVDNNAPPHDVAVGADASSIGTSCNLNDPMTASAGKHVWVFALDNSDTVVAFADHIVTQEELVP